jgi:hypothetical protein
LRFSKYEPFVGATHSPAMRFLKVLAMKDWFRVLCRNPERSEGATLDMVPFIGFRVTVGIRSHFRAR